MPLHRITNRPAGRAQNIRLPALLAFAILVASGQPGIAQTGSTGALSALEFDEIDHVYTTDAVPPPGSFQQSVALVTPQAPQQAPPQAPPKNRGVFGALSAASSVVGGASSVVASSGEIGRALKVADTAARLAPIANAMGLAGSRRFDALLQAYVLPRVSPTGAVMLQGFLSAQAEYKNRFGSPRTDSSPAAPAAAPLEPYAKGALRHYTLASNGWVRIDDPTTKTIVIIKPDAGKAFTLDPGAQTVRTTEYAHSIPVDGTVNQTASGTASFDDQVEPLGQPAIDGVPVTGYRTRSTIPVTDGGSPCPDTTITSPRSASFHRHRTPSPAANVSPAAQTSDARPCEPKAIAKHTGSQVPSDQLVLYQANTIDKRSAGGGDHYTIVIERGNFREQTTADARTFDIPAGFRQVARRNDEAAT